MKIPVIIKIILKFLTYIYKNILKLMWPFCFKGVIWIVDLTDLQNNVHFAVNI